MDKQQIAEQQKQHEAWKRQLEMAGIATGSGQQAAQFGSLRPGEIMWNPGGLADACPQEAQPEPREIERAIDALNRAVERSRDAVTALNEQTEAVQLVQPETAGREIPKGLNLNYSSPLACKIAVAAILVDEQADILAAMGRRIQL